MKYPTLQKLNTSRQMIDVFGGYNHNLRINDGEFYHMNNLTSSDYPVLSPRQQRGIYLSEGDPQGMIAKDVLCYVDNVVADHAEGARFFINGKSPKNMFSLSSKKEDCPKNLVSMGVYVIIMPDKKWVNTQTLEYGNIEQTVVTQGKATFELCKVGGEVYSAKFKQSTEPTEGVENMDLWMDTSSTPPVLKMYSSTSGIWTSVATTYIKISFPNDFSELNPLTKLFSEGDGVTISGITVSGLSDLNSTLVLAAVGSNYIVVTGILAGEEVAQDEAITIERKMPNMDFIVESENRLWGCRYGVALNGEVVNEIYASKLGDFKNWNCFAGLSTDSYVASLGTDGQFTGAITHLGHPLFFKENCLHKVYGNYPSNYQIVTTACRGVQKGSEKSLAIVNEILYYKARSAVCAYDGSLPTEVSAALGDASYSNAVAGVLGNKYYISMSDESEEYHLFVYDTAKGMWHREDDTQAAEFCNCRGDLYYIDYADKQIKTVRGTGTLDTALVKWEAITGVFGTDSPDKKYISRIDVRLLLSVGASVTFYAEYDSSGEWEYLYSKTGTTLCSFAIPMRPKRCDHMRLKITGSGDAKIYSICKTIEQGSDY